MIKNKPVVDSGVRQAFLPYNRKEGVNNAKVACILIAILMPLGISLDFFVYPSYLWYFLKLRVISSFLAMGIWWLLTTSFGPRYCQIIRMGCYILPTFFICWMIAVTEGAVSPYYAGINLVIVAANVVFHGNIRESLWAVGLLISMYLGACLIYGPIGNFGILFNNLYFLVLTGIIAVTGNYFYSRLRFREFELRYKLEDTLEELKKAEGQLVHTEKLASLGRMSAGIIHEINNPLNYFTSILHVLGKKRNLLPDKERNRYHRNIQDMEEGVDRIQQIVADLRVFTRPDFDKFDYVKAAELTELTQRFLSNQWKDKISMEIDIPEDHHVWGNKNQLVQVLLNIVQNAIDAVKKKHGDKPLAKVRIQSRLNNGYVCLTVWDNGDGIEPDHRDKIFEPFFTTKETGDGMGLGLSICYRVVHHHYGRIRVDSKPGEFSEFIMELPMEPKGIKTLTKEKRK